MESAILFHMLIKIDARETELNKSCLELVERYGLSGKLDVVTEQLPVGDVAICSGEKIIVLIERKSLADLASSISDGRYAEQSFRLNECGVPNHDIIYMVEGNLERFNPRFGRVDKAALYSSIVSLQSFKGFSVIRSNNVEESAEYVIRFANKIEKGGIAKMHSAGGGDGAAYTEVLKRKKDYLVPSNIHGLWLGQIPGVSPAVAEVVLKKFGSIWKLREELLNDPGCMTGLATVTKTGQRRAVSRRTLDALRTFLLWEGCEPE
jgi:ERCC4-type nuclease